MKKLNIHQFPITPVLGVLVPIAYLANANITQINLDDITRSIYAACGAAVILLLLGWGIYRNIHKSAVVVTFGLLLFFSYGHFYHFIHGARWIIGRHRILIPLLGLVTLALAVVMFRTRRNMRQLIGYSNIILFILFLYSAVPAGMEFYKYYHARVERRQKIREMEAVDGIGALNPDIYYIVLDMYARSDVLEEVFQYDNSAFLQDLKDMGFYVVDCSQSNYQETMLSITSTVNYMYLNDTPQTQPGVDEFPSTYKLTREVMLNNNARVLLESRGYTTVAFETGYGFSEWNDADIFYSLKNAPNLLNDFETMLANTSMVLAYTDYKSAKPEGKEKIDWSTYDESLEYRYKVKVNALRNLDNITDIPGPKFVFAHIALPHGPFVFDANGNYRGDNPDEPEGYVPQLEYTNKRMLTIMKNIIANSDVPPIIMLASDHGVNEQDPTLRMKNFMAYYVPDEMRARLYPTITPVNSFRMVFSSLGYADLPLYQDFSFFVNNYGKDPFFIVPNQCPAEK
jgi:hypothetical protein